MDTSISLQEWWPWYNKIVKTFGYDSKQDQYAADLLSELLDDVAISLNQLEAQIVDKPVLVFGAGPSLEENIRQLLKYDILEKAVLISADGATSALLRIVKIPDIIVTDLDGRMIDLFKANKAGATMVIHGHGDNVPLLRGYVPRFMNKIGTTQVEPRPNVYNFGGFTDGDRAVFLATRMGARIVVLAGMDFGRVIGRYSKTEIRSVEVKRLKLGIGRELLEWLATRTSIPLYNVTGHGEEIGGFNDIVPEEVWKII